MPSVNKNLFHNIRTINHFGELQQNGKLPQLGLYRGKKLYIINSLTDSIFEKISQIFKNILVNLLTLANFVSTKADEIQLLKREVYEYSFQQVQKHQNQELCIFEDHIKQIKNQHQLELDALEDKIEKRDQECKRLRNQIHELNENLSDLEKISTEFNDKLENIKAEYLDAQSVIRSKVMVEEEIKSLNTLKENLKKEITQLEKTKSQLLPAKVESEKIKRQIADLKLKMNDLEEEILNKLKNN